MWLMNKKCTSPWSQTSSDAYWDFQVVWKNLKLIHTCARFQFLVCVMDSKSHKVWHLWDKQGANSGFCSHIARKTEGIHAHGLAYGQPTWKYHFQYKTWQQTSLVLRPRPASVKREAGRGLGKTLWQCIRIDYWLWNSPLTKSDSC